MRTNNQLKRKQGLPLLKCMFLTLLLVSANGAWAQSDQSPTQTVCTGNEPYRVTATTGSTYTWDITPGNPGTEWEIHEAGNAITVDWSVPGVYTLSVIETNAQGCAGLPQSVVVTVNTAPNVNDLPDLTACNGGSIASINFTGSVPGTVYSWTNDNTAIGLAASGTGNIAPFNVINIGTTPIVATITVTPSFTNGGRTCTGTPQIFTITVYPQITITATPSPAAICSGATTSIALTSNTGTATFTWTAALTSGTATGFSAGSGATIAQTLTNTTNSPATVTYTITVSDNTCPGTGIDVVVTVYPLTVPTITPAVTPVCFGNTGVYTTESGMTDYTWVATGGVINSGQGTESIGVTWNGTGPYNLSVTYTNGSGCPVVTPTILPVTVTPAPVTSPIFHN